MMRRIMQRRGAATGCVSCVPRDGAVGVWGSITTWTLTPSRSSEASTPTDGSSRTCQRGGGTPP